MKRGARKEGRGILLLPNSFVIGERSQEREKTAATSIAFRFSIPHHRVRHRRLELRRLEQRQSGLLDVGGGDGGGLRDRRRGRGRGRKRRAAPVRWRRRARARGGGVPPAENGRCADDSRGDDKGPASASHFCCVLFFLPL